MYGDSNYFQTMRILPGGPIGDADGDQEPALTAPSHLFSASPPLEQVANKLAGCKDRNGGSHFLPPRTQ
uniref:Uncharacterized protein n=1 Tax=Oryza meridionalis TaxID=40149 RepID=A0A0E0DGY0_9ORYZ